MTDQRASGNPSWATPASTPRLPVVVQATRETGGRRQGTTGWSPTAWKMGGR